MLVLVAQLAIILKPLATATLNIICIVHILLKIIFFFCYKWSCCNGLGCRMLLRYRNYIFVCKMNHFLLIMARMIGETKNNAIRKESRENTKIIQKKMYSCQSAMGPV